LPRGVRSGDDVAADIVGVVSLDLPRRAYGFTDDALAQADAAMYAAKGR